MNPKVSFIVPVYNVEAYLAKCLESIKMQSFNDWECILIDDGSKDSSGNICDKWSIVDSRFKVIHKNNEGLSSARNKGLEIATGDYIMFIDSDDCLDGIYLVENLINEMSINERIDMIQFSIKAVDESGIQKFAHEEIESKIIEGEENILRAFISKDVFVYAWGKFFRRSSIQENIRFISGVYYEDERFLMEYLPTINYIMLSTVGYYIYNLRQGSITQQKFTLRHAKDLFKKDFHGVVFSRQFPYLKDAYVDYYSSALTEYINVQIISQERELHEYTKQLREVAPSWSQIYKSNRLSLSKKIIISIVKLFGTSVLLEMVDFKKKFTNNKTSV